MNDPQYSQDFRIQCDMFTGEQGDSLLELIERTAEKTGNKRIITFLIKKISYVKYIKFLKHEVNAS